MMIESNDRFDSITSHQYVAVAWQITCTNHFLLWWRIGHQHQNERNSSKHHSLQQSRPLIAFNLISSVPVDWKDE
jgi:hypothetical protein